MRKLNFILLLLFLYSCAPKAIKEIPPVVEEPDVKHLWVFKKTINVRESNTANSGKITSLIDGDSVKVLNNVKGWYQIILENGTEGWIRSDLLGPKNMSVFPKAVEFSNKLKEQANIKLFFDKDIQHKRIFLEFPEDAYSSKKRIQSRTTEIGKKYQKEVYPGKITIKVIEPKNQSEYLSLTLSGSPNANLDLPVFNYGILDKFQVLNENELKMILKIEDSTDNNALLKEARKIAGIFPLTLKSVHITFKHNSEKCILSYIEDASGERYKFNSCL